MAAIKQKELARLTAMCCSVTMKTADMLAKTFREKWAESMEGLTTEHGIQTRMCRPNQAEGTFALPAPIKAKSEQERFGSFASMRFPSESVRSCG